LSRIINGGSRLMRSLRSNPSSYVELRQSCEYELVARGGRVSLDLSNETLDALNPSLSDDTVTGQKAASLL